MYFSADFQDIHVMIFVGFAFLMTFLKKYGYSATGFNLFVAALVVQWAFLARGCFNLSNGYVRWENSFDLKKKRKKPFSIAIFRTKPFFTFVLVVLATRISLESIIGADISAAVILISMGALLGRTTPIQLLIMGLIEIVAFAANEHFQLEMLKVDIFGFFILLIVLFFISQFSVDISHSNRLLILAVQ